MAETFFTVGEGNPRAVTPIRRKEDGTTQPLDQAVPDGDTVGVQLDGTGATRFLGIDTPEKSFEQPLGGGQALDGAKWEQYLTNPFANGYPGAAPRAAARRSPAAAVRRGRRRQPPSPRPGRRRLAPPADSERPGRDGADAGAVPLLPGLRLRSLRSLRAVPGLRQPQPAGRGRARSATAVLQRATARRRPGAPVLHLAEHQSVSRRADGGRRGAAAGDGPPAGGVRRS